MLARPNRFVALIIALVLFAAVTILLLARSKTRDQGGSVGTPQAVRPAPSDELSSLGVKDARSTIGGSETGEPTLLDLGDDIRVELQVVDEGNLAIPGATISSRGEWPDILTDPDGKAILRRSRDVLSHTSLGISKEGFASARRTIDWLCPRVLVRLGKEIPVHGRVVDVGGRPIPREFLVILWPALSEMPSPGDIEEAYRNGGHLAHALSGPDGQFEINGASSCGRYFVVAGSAGFLTPRGTLVSGDKMKEDVVLVAERVFGALIRFRGAGEGPLVLSEATMRSRFDMWGGETPDIKPISLGSCGAALARVPTGVIDSRGAKVLCMYSCPTTSADVIGPCWYRGTFPGYEAVDLTFEATALEFGLAELECPLVERRGGKGSIVLLPRGATDDLRRCTGTWKNALLTLQDRTTSRVDTLVVDIDLGRGAIVQDVPAGTYDCRVESVDRLLVLPPRETRPVEVQIDDGESATVELAFDDVGAISIQATDEEGRPLDGYFRLTVAEGAPVVRDGRRLLTGAHPLEFDAPPYRIPLMRSGTYTLRGENPAWEPVGEGGTLLTLDVAGGGVERLTVAKAR